MRPRLHFLPAHLSLFAPAFMPSRLLVNRTLWAAGLVLQCVLVVAVFRRGIARRFPCFAALLCFYPLRSGLLFALAGRVDPDVYNPLFSTLAFVETLLLAAIAVELVWRITQEMNGATATLVQHRIAILAFLLCTAGLLSWLVLKFTPAHALLYRVPLDRVQLFLWFVMIAFFAVALKYARSSNPIRIAGGFAAFSLIQLATSFGRAHAYLRHNAHWYLGWSYAPAVGYIAVVCFWLCSLAGEPRGNSQS